MQARVVPVQEGHLGPLDGLYHLLGDELDRVVYAGEMLGGVEQERRAGAQQVAGLGGDYGAVTQLDGR